MSRTPSRSSTPLFLPERIHKAPVNPTTQTNPYFFTGNYAPLGEEHDIAALDIEGTLPPGLSGSLYRVGPSPQYAPRDNDYHWFSGDGMVHAFHIDAGVVSYRNRWARTPKWQLEHEAGRALFGTFGNPATSDPLVQGLNGGTANTSMLWHGDRLFALEESHQPFELDAHTLASKGHQSFGGRVDSRCTAHPKADPETGELHFFAYSPDGPCSPTMRYGVMDRHCEVTQLQSFTAPHASMAHDFMVTRGHVLFPVTPLTLSMERAMLGKPLLAWDASLRTHVGVMRRGSDSGGGGTGTLRWFDTDACHVFHVMNAWDDGDTIVAYVMQSETAPGLPDAEGRPGDPAAMAAPWKPVRWLWRGCRIACPSGSMAAGGRTRSRTVARPPSSIRQTGDRHEGCNRNPNRTAGQKSGGSPFSFSRTRRWEYFRISSSPTLKRPCATPTDSTSPTRATRSRSCWTRPSTSTSRTSRSPRSGPSSKTRNGTPPRTRWNTSRSAKTARRGSTGSRRN
jgi:carotenoid cleavage dioxygenase-like enzyme